MSKFNISSITGNNHIFGDGNIINNNSKSEEKSTKTNLNSQLFISYCTRNSEPANELYNHFNNAGIKVIKDDHELKYKDNLIEFMQSIRDAHYALVLISDEYLRSKNCLFESQELLKEKHFEHKILPILLDGTKIFNTQERLVYINHWSDQLEQLQNATNGLHPTDTIEATKDIKQVENILGFIDEYIKQITTMKLKTFEELKAENYISIIELIQAPQ